MPLHDWADDRGWSSLNAHWQHALFDWVQQNGAPGVEEPQRNSGHGVTGSQKCGPHAGRSATHIMQSDAPAT
jgi:hypothetical protein